MFNKVSHQECSQKLLRKRQKKRKRKEIGCFLGTKLVKQILLWRLLACSCT